MRIKVLKAGPLTTIQDAGRFGYMEYGIGQSGVMDMISYQEANILVGNRNNEAVLECTLMGPDLLFEEEVLLAFTGADMPAVAGGEKLSRGRAYRIKKDTVVSFGMAVNGVRTYIAVGGGFDVPVIMGSRSTNLKCGFGGYHGRKLLEEDILCTGPAKLNKKKIDRLLKKKLPVREYQNRTRIRVIEGPQNEYFTNNGIETFYNDIFKVSVNSDRMGIRLVGKSIEAKQDTDIVSDGIAFGSIQVTSSGNPIILMADHQTTGGYAKIGTVISEDLPLLAQVKPGDEICFLKISFKKRKWFYGL